MHMSGLLLILHLRWLEWYVLYVIHLCWLVNCCWYYWHQRKNVVSLTSGDLWQMHEVQLVIFSYSFNAVTLLVG